MDSRLVRITNNAKNFIDWGWIPIALRDSQPLDKNWRKIKLDNSYTELEKCILDKKVNNLGILTGYNSDLTVVELKKETGALHHWSKFISDNDIQIPETLVVQTGAGGFQIYFSYIDLEIRDEKTGIIVKSNGDYSIAPYSVDPRTGVQYLPLYGLTNSGPIIAQIPPKVYRWLKNL